MSGRGSRGARRATAAQLVPRRRSGCAAGRCTARHGTPGRAPLSRRLEGRGGLPDVDGMSTSGSMAVHVTCSRWKARFWCRLLLRRALAPLQAARRGAVGLRGPRARGLAAAAAAQAAQERACRGAERPASTHDRCALTLPLRGPHPAAARLSMAPWRRCEARDCRPAVHRLREDAAMSDGGDGLAGWGRGARGHPCVPPLPRRAANLRARWGWRAGGGLRLARELRARAAAARRRRLGVGGAPRTAMLTPTSAPSPGPLPSRSSGCAHCRAAPSSCGAPAALARGAAPWPRTAVTPPCVPRARLPGARAAAGRGPHLCL